MGLNNINSKKNKKAFTLAEVMVVILVLSIITAAFLPVISKRRKINSGTGASSADIWTSIPNTPPDIYYGDTAVKDVILGERTAVGGSRLQINVPVANTGDNQSDHILFKQGGVTTGRLTYDANANIGLGAVLFDTTPPARPAVSYAIAVGNGAKSTGSDSVSFGYSAVSRTSSVAAGYRANEGNNGTGSNSVTVGYGAAMGNGTDNNIAIGQSSAIYDSASFSTAIGSGAAAMASGATVIGATAVASSDCSIAIGSQSNVSTSLDSSIVIGYQARALSKIVGPGVAVGAYALHSSGSGGCTVSPDNYGNKFDTALGYQAMQSEDLGYLNTAVGSQALATNTAGGNGVAIGYRAAGQASTPFKHSITAVGSQSCLKTTKTNVCVGYQAGTNITSGQDNTGIGYQALPSVTTGSGNTAVGYQACNTLTTGNYNVCLGSNSSVGSGNGEAIALGTGANVTGNYGVAIGPYATATVNQIVLGGSHASAPIFSYPGVVIPGSLTIAGSNFVNTSGTYTTSDRRLKNVGGEFTDGLDKIRELKTYNFTFKKDKEKTPLVGVLAQDLQKVFPDAVTKGDDGYLMIRQDDMFYAMVNSIKQLDKIVQNLVNGLKTAVAKVKSIDDKILAFARVDKIKVKKIQELEAQNKAIELRLAKLENRK